MSLGNSALIHIALMRWSDFGQRVRTVDGNKGQKGCRFVDKIWYEANNYAAVAYQNFRQTTSRLPFMSLDARSMGCRKIWWPCWYIIRPPSGQRPIIVQNTCCETWKTSVQSVILCRARRPPRSVKLYLLCRALSWCATWDQMEKLLRQLKK